MARARGGMGAKNYVLHERWYDGLTQCGRVASAVNCASEENIDPEREEICRRCTAAKRRRAAIDRGR